MTDEFDFTTGLPSSEMGAYLQLYLDETTEQLDALVESLLVLERDRRDSVQLNEAFRLIHSIKGSAAMMGLESITALTHRLENHLERLRSGMGEMDPRTMSVMLKCVDFLRKCNDRLRDGQPLASAPELLEELEHLAESPVSPLTRQSADSSTAAGMGTREALPSSPDPPPADPPTPSADDEERSSEIESPSARAPEAEIALSDSANRADPRTFQVTVQFQPDAVSADVKAELICTHLERLGTILATKPSRQEFTQLEGMSVLHLVVASSHDADELWAVANADGVARVEVEETSYKSSDSTGTPSDSRDADSQEESERNRLRAKVSDTLRVDVERLDSLMNLAGELVINQARFVQIARQMRPNLKKSTLASQARSLGDRLRRCFLEGKESERPVDSRELGGVEISPSLELEELKADLNALEEQARVWEETRRHFGQIVEAIDQLARVSRSLQHAVLDTRMVPIAPLFNRFKRVVRDVSTELGKQVDLEIRGENTELDKRMIDELQDPLVHLVRNAIDHGIESAEDRQRCGKPSRGVVRLEAVHRGNNVFITVSDDGRGIQVERIRRRIVERGLIGSALVEQLPDEQILDFVWHPGFSTAAAVSDISGRGVGMDIVKTRITRLNGTVSIHHHAEQGTTFTIRLPLTLAIIRCLLFRLPQGVFAVPIENVREIVAVPLTQIISVLGNRTFELRGTFVPLLDIDEIFNWNASSVESLMESAVTTSYRQHAPAASSAREPKPEKLPVTSTAMPERIDVVIMDSNSQSMALRVEELLGVQDIVVKSLSENFVQTRGLAGASILGDGSVCLLLDAAATIQLALHVQESSVGRRTALPMRV